MRARTTEFIKVLNRARPEPKTTEKKTITYVIKLSAMFLTKSVQKACMRSMFSSHETCPHINKGVAILQWVPCNVKTFEVSPDAMQKTTCLEGSPRYSWDFQRSPEQQTLKYFLLKLLYCFLTSLDLKYIWKGFCFKFWLHNVKNAQKTSSSLASIHHIRLNVL